MLDILNLPKPQNGYIDYFCNFGFGSSTANWSTWEKPRGISMIYITCFGAGGGGGGSSVNQLGGGGGGSGGQTTLLIPAHVLPDILYVSPGKGGVGANTFAGTGGDGSPSYVSIAPSADAIYLACFANGGSGANGSFAGTGATIATQASALMSSQGFFFALIGQSGQTGGSVKTVTYPITGLLVSGGAGGGGGSSFAGTGAGGNITAPTQSSLRFFSDIPGSTDGTSNPGSNGISLFQPLLSTGGGGGGGQGSTGIALNGSGGNGGFGSGGGGVGNAGGSINAGTTGGSGGDGLVIIQCF